MSQYSIAVVVGSLRSHSVNHILAKALESLAPADFTFSYPTIGDLPLYNQDHDSNPAESVARFKNEIKAADAIIFVTPEYNRSIPGVLKNALDHASRPYGQSVWKDKPAGVLGASIGAFGTSMAQQHLRNILAYLDMPTLNQPETFIHVKDEATATAASLAEVNKDKLQRWLDAYVAWVKKHLE